MSKYVKIGSTGQPISPERTFIMQQRFRIHKSVKAEIRKRFLCFVLAMAALAAADAFSPGRDHDSSILTVTAEAASAPYMKITCIDLGSSSSVYGESVLLESGGQYLLMDTGSKDPLNTVTGYLKKKGIRNLSLYISHFHEDHCDYAVSIIKDSYFHVKHVYLANPDPVRRYINSHNKSHRRLLYNGCRLYLSRFDAIASAARKKGIPVTHLRRGKTFSIGSVKAKVLWDHNTRGFGSFDPYDKDGIGFQNNSSLVTKFTLGKRSFLTCGDIECSTERDLLAAGTDLSADILKLSHHGMWTSNLSAFVNSVNPCYCFYSYKNPADSEYRKFASGYETSSTLKRLAQRYNILGCRYNGTITYKVQYNTITVSAERHIKKKSIRVKNLSNGKVRTQQLVYNDAQPLFLDKRMLFSGTKIVTGTVQDRTPPPTGWYKDSIGWRYKTKNGIWLSGGWKTIGNSQYYFTIKGYRHEGWLKINGKKYFLNRLGARQTGWQLIDGKFYYFSTKNGVMLTGKTWIGGSMWPLRSDGSLDLSKKNAPNINITTSAHRHTTK